MPFPYSSAEQDWDRDLENQPELARHRLFGKIRETKNSPFAWMELINFELGQHSNSMTAEKRLSMTTKATDSVSDQDKGDLDLLNIWLLHVKTQQECVPPFPFSPQRPTHAHLPILFISFRVPDFEKDAVRSTFAFLSGSKIGIKHAAFYEAWADFERSQGKTFITVT